MRDLCPPLEKDLQSRPRPNMRHHPQRDMGNQPAVPHSIIQFRKRKSQSLEQDSAPSRLEVIDSLGETSMLHEFMNVTP